MRAMRRRFWMGLILLLCLGAHAKPYGNYHDVVRAAQADEEPAYLSELMQDFAKELRQFAHDKQVASPSHNLLFYVNVAGVIGGLRHIVLSGASHQHREGNVWDAASKSAWKSADDLLYSASRHVAYLSTPDARHAIEHLLWHDGNLSEQWNQDVVKSASLANEAMRGAQSPEIKGRLAYRVAEWKALNFLMVHAQAMLAAAHEAAKTHLYPRTGLNPFDDQKTWKQFRISWFGNVNIEPGIFINPILTVFDSLVH